MRADHRRTLRRSVVAVAVLSSLAAARGASAADAVVPGDFETIAQALAGASDADGDGVLSVLVRAGLTKERVVIERSSSSLTAEPGAFLSGGIVIRGASDVTVEGFAVVPGFESDGIAVIDSERVRLVGNVVADARRGIVVDGGSGAVLVSNDVKNCARSGIRVGGGAASAFLSKNRAHDNRRHGFDVVGAAGALIVDNAADGNLGHGFRVGKAAFAKLVENASFGNRLSGIVVASADSPLVESNVAKGNGANGLRLLESPRAVVARNVSTANRAYGLRASAGDGADFDALPGVAGAPPGDNVLEGNGLGEARID